MGHDSERTTRIYLASLDTSSVDKANKLILTSLLWHRETFPRRYAEVTIDSHWTLSAWTDMKNLLPACACGRFFTQFRAVARLCSDKPFSAFSPFLVFTSAKAVPRNQKLCYKTYKIRRYYLQVRKMPVSLQCNWEIATIKELINFS